MVWVFAFPGLVQAKDDFPFPIEPIKAALAERTVSQGPESLMLTRSPWGPEMYRQTVDGVVLITVLEIVEGQWRKVGDGTGVLVTSAGHILTNWHVVKNIPRVVVVFRRKMENDTWWAKVLATYPEKDLALLELEHSSTGSKILPPFPVIQLENPDNLMVGQDVFTIGHPEGLSWTYTQGVISQIRPRYLWEMGGRKYRATVLQTQTDISYGSSGGPLINSSGKLVGIISMLMEGKAGLNFAISAHEIQVPLTIVLTESLPHSREGAAASHPAD